MRIFIAVNLPQDKLIKIDRITTYFKSKTPPDALKWVETKSLHLTIKFIGEIPEKKIPQIQEILTQSLSVQSPFAIEVSGLGMYPHKNTPRVIWLGISGGEPLIKIHQILDQKLASLEIKPEGRDFTPHLTIARVRRNADPASVKYIGRTLSQFKVDPLGAFTVDRVHLYQSVLTPSGPIYTSLFSVSLNQV